MEERRFHREDYPLNILAEFGLTEEMIYDLPEFVHETLERGGKSPLLPICVEQPFGVTHAYAKFCLIETEEGLDVMFSPKLKTINLDAFSDDERQALLSGKVIVAEVDDKTITDEGVEEMQRIQAFVQLDRDTNGVIYTPTQVIGRNLNAVATEYELSGDDLISFSTNKSYFKHKFTFATSVAIRSSITVYLLYLKAAFIHIILFKIFIHQVNQPIYKSLLLFSISILHRGNLLSLFSLYIYYNIIF